MNKKNTNKKRDVNSKKLKIIGVDVGGTKIAAGTLVDRKLIDAVEVPIHAQMPLKDILHQIEAVIDLIWDKSVRAIGVGVPSIVDTNRGFIRETQNIPKLARVELSSILSKKYRVPVFVQNDAKCFAFGQLTDDEQHIVGLILGTGVGAGIIIDGKIYCGQNGTAGEVGGILNSESITFEQSLGGHEIYSQTGISVAQWAKSAMSHDKKAKKLFDDYGKILGELLYYITITYNPSRIVLGGSISKSAQVFLGASKKIMIKRLANQFSYAKPPLITVAPDKYPGVIGAAKLALSAIQSRRR